MDNARLHATLGDPVFKRMLSRLRRRLELGGATTGSLVLAEASDHERHALARLFGTRTTRARTITIDLQRLEALLKEGELAPSLLAAVEALTGPLQDLRAERAALEARWSQTFRTLRDRAGDSPPLSSWIDDIQSSGLLRRLASQDADRGLELGQVALTVAFRLPQQNTPLSALAAATTGDSHALDRGTTLGLLCVRAAARLAKMPAPTTTQSRRDTWAAVGVLCDELSAPVLTLNLPFGEPSSSLGTASRAHAGDGEPYRLSVRQIVAYGRALLSTIPRQIFVCENPTVVAAAAVAHKSRCAPMICIEGQPRTAARLLLKRLSEAGACLLYHGDFDWPGVVIANRIITDFRAKPWRMGVADYLLDAAAGSLLRGKPVQACWDEGLSNAMATTRRRIHEEQLLDRLLPDLEAGFEQKNA